MILAKKPIETFKSDEEFQKIARDYQHKLYLDDWNIEFKLTDTILYQDDMELWGMCAYNFENSYATIYVFNGKLKQSGDCQSKNCAELTLLHELLHIRLEYITDEDTVGKVPPLEMALKHRAIESMAKSILMFKYDVSYEYFCGTALFPDTLPKIARSVR